MHAGIRRVDRVNPRGKRWVGTWNNFPENYLDVFQNEELLQITKFLIVGRETAPTTGTPHLHFYIRFNDRIYRNSVLRYFPGCWVEEARGSELQNINYVTKEEKVLQIGNATVEATRQLEKEERLKVMLSDLMQMNWSDFEKKYPVEAFHQYKKLMDYKINHIKIEATWEGELANKNYWIYGEPGTGKSRWARSLTTLDKIYPKNTNKWWDGFKPSEHRVVVMEDFPQDGNHFAQLMKIWSDRYSFIGEVKGGQIMINPGSFFLVITSNYSIETVFPGEDAAAIRRRFKEIQILNQNDLNLNRELDFNILS